MATQADHQKQVTLQSPCLMGENDIYKHAKHDQGDQWTMMIMEGDYHHQDRSESSGSLEDSSISNGSSTSSTELVDDASSTCTSSSTNSPSSDVANGPLFELSELMAQLPIKRGLSKYYQGKSQSFTSLSRVMTIDDLAKKEIPYRKKMKTCKSYGGGLDIKATISKKASRSSFYSTSSLSAGRKGSFLGSSKPPVIPVQKRSV